ncbi:hypothetical protein M0R89_19540 (plasmid) [Halorussus limi]|uniref:Uncharacterized protein n=1 Tax=Halorussus limi TaxID=2938695 RepID=A0A8U0HZK6_9EURY|nr:hypothetical protein [Halorussus limi]UPV76357.1 hypothetical protein M0R89_19540 [Halorussus limi]
MNELSADRVLWRNVGLVLAGLVAGVLVAYFEGDVVPPVLVIGAIVVGMLLIDRYDM